MATKETTDARPMCRASVVAGWGHFTNVYTAACATSRPRTLLTESVAWWWLSAAPFAAFMVTTAVPDSPAARVSGDGLTEKDTPPEGTAAPAREERPPPPTLGTAD